VLIHHYERIDLDGVWRIVADDLPSLEAAVRALLAALDREAPEKK